MKSVDRCNNVGKGHVVPNQARAKRETEVCEHFLWCRLSLCVSPIGIDSLEHRKILMTIASEFLNLGTKDFFV